MSNSFFRYAKQVATYTGIRVTYYCYKKLLQQCNGALIPSGLGNRPPVSQKTNSFGSRSGPGQQTLPDGLQQYFLHWEVHHPPKRAHLPEAVGSLRMSGYFLPPDTRRRRLISYIFNERRILEQIRKDFYTKSAKIQICSLKSNKTTRKFSPQHVTV